MRRSVVAQLMVLALILGAVGAAPAAAAPSTGCGMVITQSMTLTADIGPCSRGGIVIAADDIDVNLGGHTISGKAKAGDGVGILLDGVTAARVSNGTVTGFDAGVAIVGGASNIVHLLDIRGNIGSLAAVRPAYGDGVVITSSSYNWIFNNTITNNGPFSGIAVLSDGVTPSETNVIERNRVVDNDVAGATANEDTGIRIEGPNALGTYITRNRIIANGLDGIAVFEAAGATNASTWIDRNVVQGNGFHGMANRKGDGIFLADQADSSLVNENEVTGNAANGIRVASATNRILATTALGNGAYPGVSAYDLNDENPNCADNEWSSRLFGTASQTCIA